MKMLLRKCLTGNQKHVNLTLIEYHKDFDPE